MQTLHLLSGQEHTMFIVPPTKHAARAIIACTTLKPSRSHGDRRSTHCVSTVPPLTRHDTTMWEVELKLQGERFPPRVVEKFINTPLVTHCLFAVPTQIEGYSRNYCTGSCNFHNHWPTFNYSISALLGGETRFCQKPLFMETFYPDRCLN